ncbi:MAG: hypothetical protein E4H28_04395 [Gemmatimonadales bacterium]|nr:MAG: hypothetical protein E4H28_04395 [Gemmatimonadales bacterium]
MTRSSRTIETFDEDSVEAQVCELHYATTRDLVLSAADWPFARKRVALVAEGTPPAEWAYRYRIPSDCIAPRGIEDGLVVRTLDERIPYAIENAGDGNGLVLLMNQEAAVLIYTMQAKNPNIYPAVFVEAFSWKLASVIARPLDRDLGLCRELLQTAEAMIGRAAARSFNQEKHPASPSSPHFTTRLN